MSDGAKTPRLTIRAGRHVNLGPAERGNSMGDLPVTTSKGAGARLKAADVAAFKASLRGTLRCPGEAGYEEARRVWNSMIDKRPALIAHCAGVADVIQAIHFARTYDLLVAVWGELDRETQAFDLATTGGTDPTTGIAGLTLGGGLGWLQGKYGLTCDNLVSADVVTANGQCLTASATEHADLFWGLRGGCGNFGIVTAFEYQLHPIGQMLGGMLLYPFDQAKDVLRFYRDYTS